MIPMNEAFATAAKFEIEKLGRGWKSKIASRLGLSPQYLSDLLSGRKSWTDPLRDKLAATLGTSVAGLIIQGEAIIEERAAKARRRTRSMRRYPCRPRHC